MLNIVICQEQRYHKPVAIIETSHIAMHIWDEPKPALMQFDVYSCGEFDVKKFAIR